MRKMNWKWHDEKNADYRVFAAETICSCGHLQSEHKLIKEKTGMNCQSFYRCPDGQLSLGEN